MKSNFYYEIDMQKQIFNQPIDVQQVRVALIPEPLPKSNKSVNFEFSRVSNSPSHHFRQNSQVSPVGLFNVRCETNSLAEEEQIEPIDFQTHKFGNKRQQQSTSMTQTQLIPLQNGSFKSTFEILSSKPTSPLNHQRSKSPYNLCGLKSCEPDPVTDYNFYPSPKTFTSPSNHDQDNSRPHNLWPTTSLRNSPYSSIHRKLSQNNLIENLPKAAKCSESKNSNRIRDNTESQKDSVFTAGFFAKDSEDSKVLDTQNSENQSLNFNIPLQVIDQQYELNLRQSGNKSIRKFHKKYPTATDCLANSEEIQKIFHNKEINYSTNILNDFEEDFKELDKQYRQIEDVEADILFNNSKSKTEKISQNEIQTDFQQLIQRKLEEIQEKQKTQDENVKEINIPQSRYINESGINSDHNKIPLAQQQGESCEQHANQQIKNNEDHTNENQNLESQRREKSAQKLTLEKTISINISNTQQSDQNGKMKNFEQSYKPISHYIDVQARTVNTTEEDQNNKLVMSFRTLKLEVTKQLGEIKQKTQELMSKRSQSMSKLKVKADNNSQSLSLDINGILGFDAQQQRRNSTGEAATQLLKKETTKSQDNKIFNNMNNNNNNNELLAYPFSEMVNTKSIEISQGMITQAIQIGLSQLETPIETCQSYEICKNQSKNVTIDDDIKETNPQKVDRQQIGQKIENLNNVIIQALNQSQITASNNLSIACPSNRENNRQANKENIGKTNSDQRVSQDANYNNNQSNVILTTFGTFDYEDEKELRELQMMNQVENDKENIPASEKLKEANGVVFPGTEINEALSKDFNISETNRLTQENSIRFLTNFSPKSNGTSPRSVLKNFTLISNFGLSLYSPQNMPSPQCFSPLAKDNFHHTHLHKRSTSNTSEKDMQLFSSFNRSASTTSFNSHIPLQIQYLNNPPEKFITGRNMKFSISNSSSKQKFPNIPPQSNILKPYNLNF